MTTSQKEMMILRGLPGSGKSRWGERLLQKFKSLFKKDAVRLSTDEFFIQEGLYLFDPQLLGTAHQWNLERANKACKEDKPLIIIDNTNILIQHMKPYIILARIHGYHVEIRAFGSFDEQAVKDCAERNTHGVPLYAIQRMAQKYQPTLEELEVIPKFHEIPDQHPSTED